MNRRALFTIGGSLAGAALYAANVNGQALEGQPQPAPPKHAEATGRVVSYGEGFTIIFTLSKMPEGIEVFTVDYRVRDRVGDLLLLAAEKGWEVRVSYMYVEEQNGIRVTRVIAEIPAP